MFKNILVPTDGSPLSLEAITRAVSFAKEAGARITFLCVIEPYPPMYYGLGSIFDAHTPTRFQETMEGTAHKILDVAVKLAQENRVECRKLVLVGEEPYQAIIEAAERNDCDLIFMASHGRRGVKGVVLGSETHKVLTHTSIPVLVHRSKATAS